MKTVEQILAEGIKEDDWTYCKEEYAPHEGCKVGMPTEFTPDGTTRNEVETCYIVTARFRTGDTVTRTEYMYLDDGRFYWYGNLWDDDEVVEQEKTDEWFIEPIAWIAYKNIPGSNIVLPVAPHKAEAVPTPPWKDKMEDEQDE